MRLHVYLKYCISQEFTRYGDNYVGVSLCWRLKIGDISFSCWKQNLDVDGIFVMFVSDSIEKEDGGHKNGQNVNNI